MINQSITVSRDGHNDAGYKSTISTKQYTRFIITKQIKYYAAGHRSPRQYRARKPNAGQHVT